MYCTPAGEVVMRGIVMRVALRLGKTCHLGEEQAPCVAQLGSELRIGGFEKKKRRG
jgi:hypothetical protein